MTTNAESRRPIGIPNATAEKVREIEERAKYATYVRDWMIEPPGADAEVDIRFLVGRVKELEGVVREGKKIAEDYISGEEPDEELTQKDIEDFIRHAQDVLGEGG